MLRNALIIEDTGDNNVVKIGKTVTFVELPGDEEKVIKSLVQLNQMHLMVRFQMNHQWLKR